MSDPCIGFAGLTHLGLCSAAAAASKGFAVTAFDVDRKRVEQIAAGRLPVLEPELDGLFAENRGRLTVTADPEDLGLCDLVYVSTDVPTDNAGQSDLTPVNRLIDAVRPHLNSRAILIVLCQVPPGFTRAIEGDRARIFYQVETLVFGRAVERAMRPERIVVGCAAPEEHLPAAYEQFLSAFGCPILPMRYESAELAKIAVNCFLVATVTTANTLAELCERIGADWEEITPALRLDARIGPNAYLRPGLGIAGGNLERDLATVYRIADVEGTDTGPIEAFVGHSGHMKDWAWRTIERYVRPRVDRLCVGVLGLTYKENTHSTKNSPALALTRKLRNSHVRVFDPVVPANAVSGVDGAATPLGACDGADAVALMTPWPEFRALDVDAMAARMRGHTIIDPYRLLSADAVTAAGLDHFVLGRPAARAARKAVHA